MARNHALHHLQHRREQLGLRGQQHARAGSAAEVDKRAPTAAPAHGG
jgi:hypothetical protein